MSILLRASPQRFGSPGSANPILTDLASLEQLSGCRPTAAGTIGKSIRFCNKGVDLFSQPFG
jgi:hypothetical protein